jgi:hypothetical protein
MNCAVRVKFAPMACTLIRGTLIGRADQLVGPVAVRASPAAKPPEQATPKADATSKSWPPAMRTPVFIIPNTFDRCSLVIVDPPFRIGSFADSRGTE